MLPGIQPEIAQNGFQGGSKTKRVAYCCANANRDWGRVMITDSCSFHFRLPGSKVRQGRWVNQSEKRVFGCSPLATHSATMCTGK